MLSVSSLRCLPLVMYAPVTLMRVLSTEYLVSSAEKLWLGDGVMSSRILEKLLLT